MNSNFQAAQDVINEVKISKKDDLNQLDEKYQRRHKVSENEQNFAGDDSYRQIKIPYLNGINPQQHSIGNDMRQKVTMVDRGSESGFSQAKDSVTSNKRNPISHVKKRGEEI